MVLASLHGTFLSIGSLLAAFIVAKLMLRYGRGRILRLGSIGIILGVLALTWPGASIGVTFAGLASVAASVAAGIAPFVLGELSQSIGFHLAFLIVPVFLICGLAILLIKPVHEIPVTN
ncbi:MAG: hypothetical protein EXQ60_08095 [Candidatus Nanopelagicales bacterium]|nr:hypothetical protein [Candidatus Nanopelagicales bacterium]